MLSAAHPFFIAAQGDHLDIVRLLVEAGSAKDQADNDGATPLLMAVRRGHLDIVRLLLKAGAAKDQADNRERTPLLLAAQAGHINIVPPASPKLVQPMIKQTMMVLHPCSWQFAGAIST